jgi:hypothetical protein
VGFERERSADGAAAAAAAESTFESALPIIPILLAFAASRILLFVVAAIVEATLPLGYHGQTFSTAPILGGLTGEDGIYFLGIAAEGYHRAPIHDQYVDWVFFPAFPILTRALSVVVRDIALAGVIVANLATLSASIAVYVLSRDRLGREGALVSVGFILFAPGAAAFGMAYSDSLLLAAVAWALFAARRGLHPLMAILFAVATLSRAPGILFGLPLAAAVWSNRRRAMDLVWLISGPLALVAFMAYQSAVLGDPIAWISGQAQWNAVTGLGPSAAPTVATGGTTAPLIVLLFVGLLVYAGLLGLAIKDRLPLPDLLVVVVPFASVFLASRLQSDLRYLVIGWPFAWVIASRLRGFGRDLWAVSLGGLYVLFALLNVTQTLAP